LSATEENGLEINSCDTAVPTSTWHHLQVFQLDPRIANIAQALRDILPQAPGQHPNSLRQRSAGRWKSGSSLRRVTVSETVSAEADPR
jgi:hypothetical protein